MRRALAVLAVVVTATVTFASPARAAVNDSFLLCTPYGVYGACVRFVDYGEGWPGNGNNDDYLVIHDYARDGYGTKAYAWLNGRYLGWKYNGNGYDGAPVLWDPFGNVRAGDYIGVKVCLSQGPDDPNNLPHWCVEHTTRSVDG